MSTIISKLPHHAFVIYHQNLKSHSSSSSTVQISIVHMSTVIPDPLPTANIINQTIPTSLILSMSAHVDRLLKTPYSVLF